MYPKPQAAPYRGQTCGIATIATNTLLADATAAVVAMSIRMTITGEADLAMSCHGAPAGLVGIIAP